MSWLSTWPLDGRPQHQEHDTEQQAKNHAQHKRITGHREALFFWSEATEVAAR